MTIQLLHVADLHFGGVADLRQIEASSFGKFWQTVRDGERLDLEFPHPELEAILDSLRERNAEKRAYGGPGWANYAAQYFNDTYRFCGVIERLLKPGAHIVIVIGNSILQGVEIKVDGQTKILVSGIDRQLVGQTAANIRALRPPEPYKNKGVRYANEVLRKKEGKTGAK